MDSQVKYGHWIGNKERLEANSFKPSLNPATNEAWALAAEADSQVVDDAVEDARGALEAWSDTPIVERVRLLRNLAALVREKAEYLARVETNDTGKLLSGTPTEMRRAADYIEYYAGVARAFQGTFSEVSPTRYGAVAYRPRGVVAALTPFNGPFTLTLWKVAPALATGNTIIIKPSPETPASPVELARLAAQAGFPAGVVNVVHGGAETGAALVGHTGVDCIAFTGSSSVGRTIAASATSAMKHVLVEGGGKSAFIVFEDADIDAAVVQAANGIFASGGQSCVAGSRLIVHRKVQARFVEGLVARAKAMRLGDPLSQDTQLGPLTTRGQIDRIEGIIAHSARDGARIIVGGTRPDTPHLQAGNYFLPTLIGDVSNEAEICQAELFGPVGVVLPFEDEAEAVKLANGTSFGLAAGIWTENMRRANRVARRMQAGTVWINCYRAFEHSLPFGGFKQSGIGRENGMEVLREYTQTQTILTEFG